MYMRRFSLYASLVVGLVLLCVPFAAFAAEDLTATPPIWATLLDYALEAVAGVLVLVLTWAGAHFGAWLRDKTGIELLGNAFEVVDDEAVRIVRALEQTMRPLLGKALADGKLTDEEKAELKGAALEVLGDSVQVAKLWELVKKAMGGRKADPAAVKAKIDGHLSRTVDAAVHALKERAGPSSAVLTSLVEQPAASDANGGAGDDDTGVVVDPS